MSCKLQRALVSTVNRVVSKYISKNTYIMKQNFYCSNMLWSSSKLFPAKNIEHHSVLYESCVGFHITKSDSSKTNETAHKNGKLVYYGTITNKIKGLKVVSYSTSLLGIIIQPMIYNNVMTLTSSAIVGLFTVMGFFTFVTPFLIHFVTKKYITEILYNSTEDTYTSKTLTFFLQDKIENFTLSDVKFNDSAGLFNTFIINGKPYMAFQEGFLDKEHYIKLLGFHKPIDLKMGDGSDVECESGAVKTANQK